MNPYMYVSLEHQALKCHHGTDKHKKKKLEKEKVMDRKMVNFPSMLVIDF
jgi:hypothetical protein